MIRNKGRFSTLACRFNIFREKNAWPILASNKCRSLSTALAPRAPFGEFSDYLCIMNLVSLKKNKRKNLSNINYENSERHLEENLEQQRNLGFPALASYVLINFLVFLWFVKQVNFSKYSTDLFIEISNNSAIFLCMNHVYYWI